MARGVAVSDAAQLLSEWESLTASLTELVTRRDALVWDLHLLMKDAGADEVETDTVSATMAYGTDLKADLLKPLLELLSEADLEGAYSPGFDKVVHQPERWNLPKLKALARKRGGQVRRLLDLAYARYPTGPKLKLKEPPHERPRR